MVVIKHKDFIDTVSIMLLLWIIARESMDKWEPRFPWVYPLW